MKPSYELIHTIDSGTGNLYYFGLHDQGAQLNFVASPLELSAVDNAESSMCVPGFGSVYLSLGRGTGTAGAGGWLSFASDSPTDSYVGTMAGIQVVKRFIRDGNKLYLELLLSNPSVDTIVVDELAISVPVNNNYTDFRYRPAYMYDRRVYEHIYPGQSSGYQIMQRLSGKAPLAYLIPLGSARFEHASHLPGTTAQAREGIPNHSWPGVSLIYLHAQGYMAKNGYKEIMGTGTATCLTLLPGEEACYKLELGLAEDMEQFHALAVDRGKLVATASPALISPVDSPVTLSIDSRSAAFLAESKLYSSVRQESGDGQHRYELVFRELGEHVVHLRNADGMTATVVFYITAPLQELTRSRADFIVANQIYENAESALNGAILCYSRRDFQGNHNYKMGLFVQEDSLWGNGSYEGGITEAMFLARKNAIDPDAGQIRALETYIQTYVHRYLQKMDTYEVFWWCGEFNSVRSFDYMHLANVYYYMHRIAATYKATSGYSAHDYLFLAYKTLMAMFEKARKMDLMVGNMGGEVMFLVLEAMETTLIAEYYELQDRVHGFQRNLFTYTPPYGSECAYDNTGYEMAMTMAGRYNDLDWMKRLGHIILAARGVQPVWWWHGSDIRWWDPEYDFSEGCHHYTSPLNSTGLQQAMDRGQLPITAQHLSSLYAGKLGAFAKIHADGSCSMSYCWEQESPNFGFHAFSGDSGLGLFGALAEFGACVYQSGAAEAQRYLCRFETDDAAGGFAIIPSSGAGNRIAWHLADQDEEASNGSVSLTAGFIQSLTWNPLARAWEAVVWNDTAYSYQNEITFQVPIQPHMALEINGTKGGLRKTADNELRATFKIEPDETVTILLQA